MAEKELLGYTYLGTPMYAPEKPISEHEAWVLCASTLDIIFHIEGKPYYLGEETKGKDFFYVYAPSKKWGCDLSVRYKVDKKTLKIIGKEPGWPEPKED